MNCPRLLAISQIRAAVAITTMITDRLIADAVRAPLQNRCLRDSGGLSERPKYIELLSARRVSTQTYAVIRFADPTKVSYCLV